MKANLRGAAVRLAVFLAVCLLGVFGLFAVFGQLRFGEKTHTYRAEFTNVTGLENDDFVRIAGVEVGKVKNVAIQPDTTALVEFTADRSVVLTEGSRAVIRYDDLIGGRYLALEEGAGGTKKLKPGDTIPLARTSPALDLDALIGGFRPLFRALDPDQVNALSGQLIQALQGQGATINSFLAQTAALTNTLADRDQLIGEVIVNLNTVLGSLGDQSDQFAKAVDALAELVKGLASPQAGHQQRRWPTPTPPPRASPTCWRRPAHRLPRRSTRPTAPRESWSPTTTTSTTCSTPCRTRIKRWRGKASTATSSASTCATSCSSSTARAASRCTSRSPARAPGGARRDEAIR